jgi:hypothetical protein
MTAPEVEEFAAGEARVLAQHFVGALLVDRVTGDQMALARSVNAARPNAPFET